MFDHLPPDMCKKLLMHLFSYVNDENPNTEDPILNALFSPIKAQLKRDLVKWEKRAKTSRDNGSLGGRPRTQINPDKPNGLNNNPDKPGKPDSVNVTVNVNDTVRKKNIEERKQAFILHTQEINFKDNILDDFTLNDKAKGFIPYWTEHGIDDKKMAFEKVKSKSFNISRRLHTWKNNAIKYSKNGNTDKIAVDFIGNLNNMIDDEN